jgi:predicted GNAT superfamily acetyltransferase
MTADIIVRPLHSLEEFHRCVEIAREVWSDSELDTEPYVTFVIANHTGGQVLGAFDGDTMVGFTKAFVGLHGRSPYLHSHMAAVLPSHRDRRVGRQLKLFQREDALGRGIRLIEWTFDPLETKNAHFNINRLGAICRRYIPNFYGMPTDRLLVEWHLDSPRAVAAISDLTPEPRDCPAHIHLPISALQEEPARLSDTERGSAGADISPRIELQSRIRTEFTQWFIKGYAVLGVRFTRSGVDYCLSPWSDF